MTGRMHIVERRPTDGSEDWGAFCGEFWWTAEDAQKDAAERNRMFKGMGYDWRAVEYVRAQGDLAGVGREG